MRTRSVSVLELRTSTTIYECAQLQVEVASEGVGVDGGKVTLTIFKIGAHVAHLVASRSAESSLGGMSGMRKVVSVMSKGRNVVSQVKARSTCTGEPLKEGPTVQRTGKPGNEVHVSLDSGASPRSTLTYVRCKTAPTTGGPDKFVMFSKERGVVAIGERNADINIRIVPSKPSPAIMHRSLVGSFRFPRISLSLSQPTAFSTMTACVASKTHTAPVYSHPPPALSPRSSHLRCLQFPACPALSLIAK